MAMYKKKSAVAAPTSAKAPTVVPVTRSETKGSGTATPPRAVATPLATSPVGKITYEQIAARAYEVYLKRGFGPGDALSDWLEAERQLKAGR